MASRVSPLPPASGSDRSRSNVLTAVFSLGLLLVLSATAWGETLSIPDPTVPLPAASAQSTLDGLLQVGRQYEAESRWGEALTHYEGALREYPDNSELLNRQDLTRLHYSLEHRYHDRSFQQSVHSLTASQALSLYSELLRKINAHYVVTPPWNKLGLRAAKSLDVALADGGVP